MFELYNVLSISNLRVRKLNNILILSNERRNQTSSRLVLLRLYNFSYKKLSSSESRVNTKNIIIVYTTQHNKCFWLYFINSISLNRV